MALWHGKAGHFTGPLWEDSTRNPKVTNGQLKCEVQYQAWSRCWTSGRRAGDLRRFDACHCDDSSDFFKQFRKYDDGMTMKIFSASLALGEGNPPATIGFPSKWASKELGWFLWCLRARRIWPQLWRRHFQIKVLERKLVYFYSKSTLAQVILWRRTTGDNPGHVHWRLYVSLGRNELIKQCNILGWSGDIYLGQHRSG